MFPPLRVGQRRPARLRPARLRPLPSTSPEEPQQFLAPQTAKTQQAALRRRSRPTLLAKHFARCSSCYMKVKKIETAAKLLNTQRHTRTCFFTAQRAHSFIHALVSSARSPRAASSAANESTRTLAGKKEFQHMRRGNNAEIDANKATSCFHVENSDGH